MLSYRDHGGSQQKTERGTHTLKDNDRRLHGRADRIWVG
jgi:hypothetical protein